MTKSKTSSRDRDSLSSKDHYNFPLTRLSLIERAHDVDGAIREKALQEFISSYRPSLIDFLVRCKEVDVVEAEDVVQDFLLNKIMNGKVLQLAGKKGRFRSLLRACLQNFLIDTLRKKKREKIDDQADLHQVDTEVELPTDPIDQVWAIAIFREALLLMKQDSEYWGIFFDRILTQPPLPYSDIICKHGLESPVKASNALMTAKRQFNRIIEGLIAKQSYLTDESSEDEIASEIEFLRQQLADSNLLGLVIDALPQAQATGLVESVESDNSVFADRLLFIDEGADTNWSKPEAKSILYHLLSQPAREILSQASHSDLTILELTLDTNPATPDMIADVLELKKLFNHHAKTGTGPLPERVNVTMTFVMIAAYVIANGNADAITSTRSEVLLTRLAQLVDKDWIPNEITTLCQKAVAVLGN